MKRRGEFSYLDCSGWGWLENLPVTGPQPGSNWPYPALLVTLHLFFHPCLPSPFLFFLFLPCPNHWQQTLSLWCGQSLLAKSHQVSLKMLQEKAGIIRTGTRKQSGLRVCGWEQAHPPSATEDLSVLPVQAHWCLCTCCFLELGFTAASQVCESSSWSWLLLTSLFTFSHFSLLLLTTSCPSWFLVENPKKESDCHIRILQRNRTNRMGRHIERG